MKAEIEQIFQADDAAWAKVTQAQVEAALIRTVAQQQAEELAASQQARLAEAAAAKVQAVLVEGKSKAQQVETEADQYFPLGVGHHTTELYQKYPLQLISPHPRFSFHTMGDGKDSIVNDVKDHRVLIAGYYYWIVRIHARDAEERGIQENDLV